MAMTKQHDDRVRAGKISAQTRLTKYGHYFSPETLQRTGQRSMHVRWHTARGLFSEKCVCCLEELLAEQNELFKKFES
jgi:hypothetical protein